MCLGFLAFAVSSFCVLGPTLLRYLALLANLNVSKYRAFRQQYQLTDLPASHATSLQSQYLSVMLLQRLPSYAYAGDDIPHWHRPFRESILIICILRRPTPTTSLNLLGVPRLATRQLFLFPDLTLVPSGRPSLFPLIFFSLLSSSF